jgi:hypothetical protein
MVDDGTVGYVVLEACFRHWLTNRSPKTTANCVLTSNHSRGRRFHSSAQYRGLPGGVVRHPDPEVDLAIVPLRPLERAARDLGVQLYYHAIDSQRIPDAATVRGFDALEDVLFVGYPSGVWDQVNLMPILRRGTTATPLELEFEGHKQFLIDAAVYPGSSGSPVFVVRDDPLRPRGDAARTIWFAGVIAAVFFREEANQRLGRCRRRPRLSPSVPR